MNCVKNRLMARSLRPRKKYSLIEPIYLMPLFDVSGLSVEEVIDLSLAVTARGKIKPGTEFKILSKAKKSKDNRLWFKVLVGKETGWFNSAGLVCEEINGE